MKVKRIILWVMILCPLLFTACSGKYLDGIVDAAPAAGGFTRCGQRKAMRGRTIAFGWGEQASSLMWMQ